MQFEHIESINKDKRLMKQICKVNVKDSRELQDYQKRPLKHIFI